MHETNIRALEDAFVGADLVLEKFTEQHWRLHHQGIAVDYWPHTGTAQAFARVFKPASPQSLVSALKSGRIDMPGEASAATCRDCSEPIWWLESKNAVNPKKSGRKTPVNSDGTVHWGSCKGKKKNRASRAHKQATMEFLDAAAEAFNDEIPF